MSDILKSVIQDLINDRTEQAQVSLHEYIVGKTQQLTGISGISLNEAADDTPDYSEQVKSLVGAEFEFEGLKHKITKVQQQTSYGQNYNLTVTPAFAKIENHGRKSTVHPYGPSRKFPRLFSELLGGLTVEFSEMGMQGDNYINVDVRAPKKTVPVNVKKGLEAMKAFAESRGWAVTTTTTSGNYIIQRKGKGKLMLAYLPATEDKDGTFALQGYASYGWNGISHAETADKMLDSMQNGYAKKYFTVPKSKAE